MEWVAGLAFCLSSESEGQPPAQRRQGVIRLTAPVGGEALGPTHSSGGDREKGSKRHRLDIALIHAGGRRRLLHSLANA
jgi:hypothetical protein